MDQLEAQAYINANTHKIVDVEINSSSVYINFMNGDTVIISQGDYGYLETDLDKNY